MLSLAALAVGGLRASAAPAKVDARAYWLVLSTDRDGQTRGYSVRPDGSRLSPLLPHTKAAVPSAISEDGGTLIYRRRNSDLVYVSRADGRGLRQLRLRVPEGLELRLSGDGRLLAFTRDYDKDKQKNGIWIAPVDGSGLRRVSPRPPEELAGWSPDRKALLAVREIRGLDYALVVQPLRGPERVLVRGGLLGSPRWSPDGRWIAYSADVRGTKQDGVYLVRPDGSGRHRVIPGSVTSAAWSPSSRTLAVAVDDPADVVLVGVDGKVQRRLALHDARVKWNLAWSPDARFLAFRDSELDHQDVWVVDADGSGALRLTSGGTSDLVGWTPLAPVQPAAPQLLPSEHVLDANTVATRRPVSSLSADDARVAFTPGRTSADCGHVAVWTKATKTLDRFRKPAPCTSDLKGVGQVELAGSRAAWIDLFGCGNYCYFGLVTATISDRARRQLAEDETVGDYEPAYHLHGNGDLLVFNLGSRLLRVDSGGEACSTAPGAPALCQTIRTGAHACCAESVSGHLIAIREAEGLAVLDDAGRLLRNFPFKVDAARLDGDRVVVARVDGLEVYDVASGVLERQRPLPAGYKLLGVDGGIAALSRVDDALMLLRLDDGRSVTLRPGVAPRLADLVPTGLYYSYATAGGEGRVVFMPRNEILRLLGGS